MKLYADLPGRRILQVLADVLIVVWVLVWIWVARLVHRVTMSLATPGDTLAAAGRGFRQRMLDAGAAVDDLPLIDDRLATPFNGVAGVGNTLEAAGMDLADAVGDLALVLALVTAATPIVLVGALWLWRRVRFVRRAGAAQHFIDADADLDLFALRAIARQPMHRLAAISPDPAGAWRASDATIIRALAALELRDSGLRVPENR